MHPIFLNSINKVKIDNYNYIEFANSTSMTLKRDRNLNSCTFKHLQQPCSLSTEREFW